MVVTTTSRLAIPRWSVGTDPYPGRAGFDAQNASLEALTAIYSQGTLIDRPAPGKTGRWYWATDTARIYYDNGSLWTEVNAYGGGLSGALTFSAPGNEGTSTRSARLDHTHPMPSHVDATHAGIHLNALAAPTADVSMGSHKITGVLDPTGAQDAATLNWVNARLTASLADAVTGMSYGGAGSIGTSVQYAREDHTHPLPALPAATSSAAGTMSAADKAKLDAAGTDPSQHSTIVMREASGNVGVTRLFAGADATSGHSGGIDEDGVWGLAIKAGVSQANRGSAVVGSAPASTASPAAYPLGMSFANVAGDTSWPSAYGLLQTNRFGANRVTQILIDLIGRTYFRAYDGVNTPVGWRAWHGAGADGDAGNISATGGYRATSFAGAKTPAWSVDGRWCSLEGGLETTSGGAIPANTQVSTGAGGAGIPDDYWPKGGNVQAIGAGTGDVSVNFYISTGGNIVVRDSSGPTAWFSLDAARWRY